VPASNGRDALAIAREKSPDLILLDRNMPGMSGDDVLGELRADSRFENLPVLILSGSPVEPGELRAIGATAAVLKPFDVKELVESIRRHLS
jgi:two-component system KDP operon response regulator KdpE